MGNSNTLSYRLYLDLMRLKLVNSDFDHLEYLLLDLD